MAEEQVSNRIAKRLVHWLAPAFLAVGAMSTAVAEAKQVSLYDYCLQLSVPPGAPVCVARVVTHAHGYYYVLNGKPGCHYPQHQPVRLMTAWGDFNALDYSLQRQVRIECKGKVFRSRLIEKQIFVVPHMHSKICLKMESPKLFSINLIAPAGMQPAFSDPSKRVPWVFFVFTLTTDRQHLGKDMVRFRSFLSRFSFNRECLKFYEQELHTDFGDEVN